MPNFCAAPNCTRKSTQSDLAFFRFPRDPDRCKIWVENCRRADLETKTSDLLNKHYRLCAKHFDPAMVCKTSPYRTVLKDTAIPTIFDLTSHLKNPHARHRKRIKELTDEDIRKIKERRLASTKEQQASKTDDANSKKEPQMSTEEKEYRDYLRSLFKTFIGFTKQAITFATQKIPIVDFKSTNLQSVLDYYVNIGDEPLTKRFETIPLNADCVSESQQIQLLDVCENTVREEMLMEVRVGRFFSLVTGDIIKFAGKKHLPLFLRFVNQQNLLKEELFDFVPFEDSDEAKLVERIQVVVTERWGLAMEDCRGQAHKATGNSAASMKAVGALLMEKYPLALHMPCSHIGLNIHLANNLPFPNVQIVMETLRHICAFFKNPFAQAELEKSISKLNKSNEEKENLITQVRCADWTEQHNVFDVLPEILPALEECMSNFQKNIDVFDSGIVSNSYLITDYIADFEFIVTIVVLKYVLTFTRAFGRNLLGETLDVFSASNCLIAVLHSLNEVNDNIDVYHEFWYDEALLLATAMGVSLIIPRHMRKQEEDEVVEIQAESYFKEFVTIPVIRGVMQEVEDMFSDSNIKALKCLSLVPAIMGQMKFNTTEENYAEIYRGDLPNPDTLPAELHCWRIKWKHRGKEVKLPTTIHETLQLPDVKFFPNVNSFLKLLSTLPVMKLEDKTNDTASERLQTYLRKVDSDHWNKSQAMLHVNAHVKHDIDVMVDKFWRLYSDDEPEMGVEDGTN